MRWQTYQTVAVHASKMPSINKFLPLDEETSVSEKSKEVFLTEFAKYKEEVKKINGE